MTITRPTTDTSIGTTKPTIGTSWLQQSQTRTEVRMTQEEYRRQEVRQTLDKVSKVEKVDKVERMEKVERVDTNTADTISRPVDSFAERGSWTMTVTDHLLRNSENKDSRHGENHLVEEEALRRQEAETAEMRKKAKEEEEKKLLKEEEKRRQQDLDMRKRAQFEEEKRLKEEEERVRKAKDEEMVRLREEETRKAIEEEIRLKREEVEKNSKRDKEHRLRRDELANQTLLQTSTPKKEEKHLVVSRQEISEEERQEMLRERQEFLRIPRQEMEEEEEEIGRTRKYFITQQEIVFYVKVTIITGVTNNEVIFKDSEGVVRIIHRPLLKREEVTMVSHLMQMKVQI